MIKKIIKKTLAKLYAPVFDLNPEYLRLIERAYKAGYNYHQKIAKNEPELMAWIGRERYFDDD
jgi:hypothetical protein